MKYITSIIASSLISASLLTFATNSASANKTEQKELASVKQNFLKSFSKAWSTQNTDKILSFYAEAFYFEDIPFKLKANNKYELKEVLTNTFAMVPDFKMEVEYSEVQKNSIFMIWIQSGTATNSSLGIDGKNYKVRTSTTLKLNDEGKIVKQYDNWDTSVLSN